MGMECLSFFTEKKFKSAFLAVVLKCTTIKAIGIGTDPAALVRAWILAWRYIVVEDYVKQASENTRSGLYHQPSSGISISNTFNGVVFTKYEPSKIPMNKYQKVIYGKDQNGNVVKCIVDVYDVLEAWKTTNPALQHLIKKALQPGERGHKNLVEDLKDIIASAQRALEIEQSKEVLK